MIPNQNLKQALAELLSKSQIVNIVIFGGYAICETVQLCLHNVNAAIENTLTNGHDCLI